MPTKKNTRRIIKSTSSGGDTASTSTATDSAPAAARRRVQRAGAARPNRVPRGSTAADLEPLDPADAAIPFDHVPYVPADLRRVTLMAAFMVVLIIIAALVVPHLIGS